MFQSQTYPNKELLILSDGDDVRDLVPDDPRIRLVHIEESYLIGQKRNFGASLSDAPIICHWDDDDYSAPSRLEDQVRRLEESGLAVTGYSAMLFTDGSQWWKFTRGREYALGTSLMYRKSFWREHPFPNLQVFEDGTFVGIAHQKKQLVSVDAGELMAASVHPTNTSQRTIEGDSWARVKAPASIQGWPVV